MKVMRKSKIGDKIIINYIEKAVADPEKTKLKVLSLTTPKMSKKEIKRLYEENAVYSLGVGEDVAELIDDTAAAELEQKLEAAGEHRLVLDNGEFIANYIDAEYWGRKKSMLVKEKITEIGIKPPKDAITEDSLTPELRAEIAAQQEEERIAALTPEQKAEEKRAQLHAIAREAILQREEAELLGEVFDPQVYLQPKRAEVERKYA